MTRPTFAEIDLDAVAFNIGQIRRRVGRGIKICPMVKADAYGHGAVEVSKTLLHAGADMLAVATIGEAEQLREAGIDAPILNLQCMLEEEIPRVLPLDVTCAVYRRSFAEELSRQASAAGKRLKVHLKVDTGMGRVGVQVEEAVEMARVVSRLPGIEMEGIFTHFPCADEDYDEFTTCQIRDFMEITQAIERSGISIPIKHAANSAGILSFPESHLDMVRPGIIAYGIYDGSSPIELRQAMTLKTRIVHLKELCPGRTVSYGRTFTANRQTVVATIPIGYADGYNRLLSNKAPALVRGMRVPVIGRVCMDMTMLDVTNVPDVRLGDEVVLYGSQDEEHISIREIASLLDTITYEVTCSVSSRVPRIYKSTHSI